MRAVDIIEKKRDGQALSTEEVRFFVEGYTQDMIPDYQAAAWLMAIYLNGMTREETVALTLALAESGHMMELHDVADYVVDKHSSGGVGDTTTLVVLPLVASCGVPIAKMSGRGLGFSGGTLDKLESIPGFNVHYSDADFHRLAREHRLIIAGQTSELAPADGKFYALRDVTATVASTPLIASSIMSKKLAGGADGIVLDVKCGVGSFMETEEEARELAQIMVEIGEDAGRDVVALISDMSQPLGVAVGNALEVKEAIATLQGAGPQDLIEHCIKIATYMLELEGRGERRTDHDAIREELREKLADGSAFEHFRRMVAAQGGDLTVVDDPSQLPTATHVEDLIAGDRGYVQTVLANEVARATLILGAGRATKEAQIDPAVGVEILVNVGDAVVQNEVVARIHANDAESLEKARVFLNHAITYSHTAVDPIPLFYGVVDGRVD